MTVTLHVSEEWSALIFAIPIILVGVAMMRRPAMFARWQAEFYCKRYGIAAGPIGGGTRLFYRAQGVFLATLGMAIVVKAFLQ